MATRFILQASGAMRFTFHHTWDFEFAAFVTDEQGGPVEGLTQNNFSVWNLTEWSKKDIVAIAELESGMPGIYALRVRSGLDSKAAPQQFLFGISVVKGLIGSGRTTYIRGITTMTITHLGAPPEPD